MFLHVIKGCVGALLLPAVWAVSVGVYRFYNASTQLGTSEGVVDWALPIGFLLWVALFFLLPRPFRTYVLGHELTHALCALLMGARVGKMKVSREGGYVELSKTNFIITLSPYFFPFYTFIVIAAYYLFGIWFVVEAYKVWWLGAVGFTWAFHLTFTVHMLAEVNQPDILKHGYLFSYVTIYLMNVLLLGLWIALIGAPTFRNYVHVLVAEIQVVYWQLGNLLLALCHLCKTLMDASAQS